DRDHCGPGPGGGHGLREGRVGVGLRLLLGPLLLLLDRLLLRLGHRLLLLGHRLLLRLGHRLLLLGGRLVLGRGLPLRGPLLLLLFLLDRRLVLGRRLLLDRRRLRHVAHGRRQTECLVLERRRRYCR